MTKNNLSFSLEGSLINDQEVLFSNLKLNIKKPLENLKEIIFTESDFWEIVLNNYKLFPNIESFNFNSFGEVGEKRVYINPNDLELFPKLQNVKLDQSSFYLFGDKK